MTDEEIAAEYGDSYQPSKEDIEMYRWVQSLNPKDGMGRSRVLPFRRIPAEDVLDRQKRLESLQKGNRIIGPM